MGAGTPKEAAARGPLLLVVLSTENFPVIVVLTIAALSGEDAHVFLILTIGADPS